MKKLFVVVCVAAFVVIFFPPAHADPFIWDNQNHNGIWNDPVNWGIITDTNYNVEPTSGDVALFRSSSPGGTVRLIADGFTSRIRQVNGAPTRFITIGPSELVDRTLTMTGTDAELFDCGAATADVILDGTPTWDGARLKLKINGSGTGGTVVNSGRTLRINCDVSGPGGFILNAGSSGAGTLYLGGSNTYAGPTTINAGTLQINGSIDPASAVSVGTGAPSATLVGNGMIGGSLTVGANGTIAPGTSVGTLAVNGDLTLSGKLQIEVDKTLTQSNDLITVNGTLTNTGSGTVTVINLNPSLPLAIGDTFQLFNQPLANGGGMSIVSSGGEVWTNKLAVDGSIAVIAPTSPPPATVALAATGVTSNSFTARWSSSTTATGYRLDVSTNSLFSSFVSGYEDLDVGNVLSWNVGGVSGNTTNYYRVRAYNANGTSGNSGTIIVAPPTGDPTETFVWAGAGSSSTKYWSLGANWKGGVAPVPHSSSVCVFTGNLGVPTNWPYIDTNYGTTILIFSNDVIKNGIKILGGVGHTMNLGSYVLQLQSASAESPSYFGIDAPIAITWAGHSNWVINANFTNALGDASCGGQTDFRCLSNRLDVYGVLKDGAGASSKLIKSGDRTLNITGQWPNTYTGGTFVNAGPIKMQKPPGYAAIPGDCVVNGAGGLIINMLGGEQIADLSIVTLNDSGYFDLIDQPETVRTIQSASAGARIMNVGSTLTVAPMAGGTYNGGVGVSDFAGSISGSGTIRMNGTGTYGMLGANSVANVTVNSGRLKVNGNSGTGAVTVNNGGTLLGQGTIAGAVTVAGGGTVGAGFSAGKLTLANGLNLSAGGNGPTNVWELATLKDDTTGVAGTDFDQIMLTGGSLALGAQAALDLRFTGTATAPDAGNPFWQTAHSWTVVSLAGGANPGSSNFGRIENGSYAAGNFTTAANGTGIVLSYTPNVVPVAAPPVISSIVAGGAASVTISYSNALPGSNYVLSYSTNLGGTNWFSAGSKVAAGVSDAQTDNSATNGQRYYRVYYLMP